MQKSVVRDIVIDKMAVSGCDKQTYLSAPSPLKVASSVTCLLVPRMMVKIQRADEVADFATCLGDIDNIFFQSSAKRDFSSQEEKQAFREMSLGRYIEKHRGSFFVALDADGRAVGYLAGCLENPITLNHFNDVAYFRSIEDICRDYPAHLHVNVAKRHRNRGLGTALVGRFVEWAKLHSLEGIHLVTSSTARSIPFYRRSGFTELRTFPWNVGTSVCMGRKL
jgi:GNAT superfamily N-acetyltransferase